MPRPLKQKQNPIQATVGAWLDSLPPALLDLLSIPDQPAPANGPAEGKRLLRDRAPKRWVVYEPMVLLPSGSFAAAPWPALLNAVSPAQASALWTSILDRLSPAAPKPPLTHLAVNEGIPLRKPSPPPPPPSQPQDPAAEQPANTDTDTDTDNTHVKDNDKAKANGNATEEEEAAENILRSPTNLRPLHGSFGPPPLETPKPPTESDFAAALWVSTTQNGLRQAWAPRHTMFSRGNVTEKARLLSAAFPPAVPSFLSTSSSTSSSPGEGHGQKWAVDLYAGIGYFVFSYAARGFRVLCWELNPWSVEGLRRGARENGFSVRVMRPDELPGSDSGRVDTTDGGGSSSEVVLADGGEQIIVFLEDNRRAAGRIRRARERMAGGLEVVHVNCGFLPTSEPVWRDAWEILTGGGGREGGEGAGKGWLHLHENVGAGVIETRKGEVERLFDGWQQEQRDGGEGGGTSVARVEHVEQVKTYAPGVWHCVFDVCITRSSAVR